MDRYVEAYMGRYGPLTMTDRSKYTTKLTL
jgi:hypothetical protein